MTTFDGCNDGEYFGGWPLGMSVIVNAKVSGKWISIIGMVIVNSCLFRPITAGVTIGA